MGNLAAGGLSEGLAWFAVAGVLFVLMGALMLVLLLVRARGVRPRAGARHGRAEAAAVRAQARLDRQNAAILRKVARDDRAGRRTRRGAPWSSTGMNVLLLLMLMAPYADRLTLGV